MLGSIYNELTRNAWTMVPGNKCTFTRDTNGYITAITYYQGDNVVFIQQFTNDASGEVLQIECVKP